jgi:hypothetical protein
MFGGPNRSGPGGPGGGFGGGFGAPPPPPPMGPGFGGRWRRRRGCFPGGCGCLQLFTILFTLLGLFVTGVL